MQKWLVPVGAWVSSDLISMLQIAWMREYWPHAYDATMGFFSPISMEIHTLVVSSWAVAKELAVALASNTS